MGRQPYVRPGTSREPYVRPGTGWPDDPAEATTPVAASPGEVARLARSAPDLRTLTARQSVCRGCPRLVHWREHVAVERRAAFAGEAYWGRPVPGWGDAEPRVLIVGLAPAAHGGNRTGRVFTGDRSGDWLFAALHRAGLAASPTSTAAGDGQRLLGARLVAAVRCAPPANKPLPAERDACAPWLDREVQLVAPWVRVVVALGAYAWDAVLRCSARLATASSPAGSSGGTSPHAPPVPRAPRARFAHAGEAVIDLAGAPVTMVGSYHPSQQNTFTGRLTAPMLDAVLARAADLAQAPGGR
ncbi:MAG TPA: uracil-DNA glycosylase [Actinomycetes bacterium]|nr:uracil-DNA glycosylase [Actinomycetes bacterium]